MYSNIVLLASVETSEFVQTTFLCNNSPSYCILRPNAHSFGIKISQSVSQSNYSQLVRFNFSEKVHTVKRNKAHVKSEYYKN